MILYKVTFERVPVTPEAFDNIKTIAYLMYGALLDYESERGKKILYGVGIGQNELIDKIGLYDTFDFEHTDYENGKYEPFMINKWSFGFTVCDDSFPETDMEMILGEVMGVVGVKYDYVISTEPLNSERDRKKKIRSLYNK